jgi:hypothetical protein
MASWLHLTPGLGLLMGRDDDWSRSNSTCLPLLVQKMARSLSLYSACIPWGFLRRVLVTGEIPPFLPDSRGVRSRQCDNFTGRDYPLRAATSTEPWLLAARSPPLVGRAPAWHMTYRELSRLGVLNTMIGSTRRVDSDQVYSQYIAGPRSHAPEC